MSQTSAVWTENILDLAGNKVQLIRGGSGDPMLVLHDELGPPGWLNFHEKLSKDFELYLPSHAGYGKSKRLDWIMNMRDLAGWYLEVLDDLDPGPMTLMGFSMGGWLAAEMAVMCPDKFKNLILVSPTGIRPPTGEIYDIFLVMAQQVLSDSFWDASSVPEFKLICPDEPSPELTEFWEVAREESCRLSWRPYMHNLSLPNLLHRLKMLKTLILWGREDAIVPLSAGDAYQQSIAGSHLHIIEQCGHRPEVEKTQEFVEVVSQFVKNNSLDHLG